MRLDVETYHDPQELGIIHEELGGINTAVLSGDSAENLANQLTAVKRSALESVPGEIAKKEAKAAKVLPGPTDLFAIAFAPFATPQGINPFIYGYVQLQHQTGYARIAMPVPTDSYLITGVYTRGHASRYRNRSFQHQGVAAAVTLAALKKIGNEAELSFGNLKTLGEEQDELLAYDLATHGLLTKTDQLTDPDQYGVRHKRDSPNGTKVPGLVRAETVMAKLVERRSFLTQPSTSEQDLILA